MKSPYPNIKGCHNCGEVLIKPAQKTDRCVDCDKNVNWDIGKWYKRWYPKDTVPGDESERLS
jgi:DNA-directed RNA polymerase subunit M/transcription elongation factor TFIIS